MRYLATLLLGCMFAVNATAQTPLTTTQSQPDELFEKGYLDLPEPLRVQADVEYKVIRYFYDFSCPYCKSLKDVMQTWSTTIPREYRFVYHHVGSNDQIYYLKAASMTFVANLDIPASDKHIFMDHMFQHVGKAGTPEMMMRLIKEAATDINIDIKQLARYLVSDEAQVAHKEQIALQRKINLKQTPSILIGGRFLTHLGLTDGRPELWIELINKVTSVHYYLNQQETVATTSTNQ